VGRSLKGVRHLALDLDGTLYLGGRLFPFTLPFLARLKELGLGRTFFTNNSSVSTRGYVEKLNKLGIDADIDDVHSSTCATLEYLRTKRPDISTIRSVFDVPSVMPVILPGTATCIGAVTSAVVPG